MVRERYVGTWTKEDGSEPERVYLAIDEEALVNFILQGRKARSRGGR